MPKKIDSSTNASMKLLGLFVLLLFSGRRFSLSELARKFSCSKQTILRLIDQLSVSREMPVRILVERQGRENLYWAAGSRRPLNVSIRPESIQKLFLCHEAVCHLLPESFRRDIEETIRRTTVLLDDFDSRPLATGSYVSGMPKGRIDYSGKQETLRTLMKAITRCQVCKAVYHAPKHKAAKEYSFVPQLLAVYRDALYVRGYSFPEGEENKTFAVHRFESVELTPIRHKPRTAAAAAESKPFGFMQGSPFLLKVEFMPPVAAYVEERIWSDDQKLELKRNGNLVLSFSATDEREVLAWILSFGKYAKILEPAGLADSMKDELKSLGRLYAP